MSSNSLKILICGPECSGKTILAHHITKLFGMKYIPEYAVEYLDGLEGRMYDEEDLLKIAKGHYDLFLDASAKGHVVLDTFLLNIKIWAEYKFDRRHAWIDERLSELSFDRVFLMTPDLEWEEAKYRENPDDRDVLFQMYLRELGDLDWEFSIIEGQGKERFKKVEQSVRELVNDL